MGKGEGSGDTFYNIVPVLSDAFLGAYVLLLHRHSSLLPSAAEGHGGQCEGVLSGVQPH